jgi:hypothetical protein
MNLTFLTNLMFQNFGVNRVKNTVKETVATDLLWRF